jgi:hypothetical protein
MTCDAENIFGLLNARVQQITLDDPVEIRKQNARENFEEPDPERRDRIMTVSKLTEGFGLTYACVKLFEDIDTNKQK